MHLLCSSVDPVNYKKPLRAYFGTVFLMSFSLLQDLSRKKRLMGVPVKVQCSRILFSR